MIEAILSVSILAGSMVLARTIYCGFHRHDSGERNARSTETKRQGKAGRPKTRREIEPEYDRNDDYGAYLPERRNDVPISYGAQGAEGDHAADPTDGQSFDPDSALTIDSGGSAFSLGDFDGFDFFV